MIEHHKVNCSRCKLDYTVTADIKRDKDGRILSMETLSSSHGRGDGICPINPERKNRRQTDPELG